MRKLVSIKIIFLVILLICAVTPMEAKTVYVSLSGSGDSGNPGTNPAAPVNFSRFLTIFRSHTSAQGATFYAYFEPGTYTLAETLTLIGEGPPNQGGVLFVLDKKPGTTGNVIFKPGSTSDSGAVGVFVSSPQTAGTGGCNITFRNMIFDGFRGHQSYLSTHTATSGYTNETNRRGYRLFTVKHNSITLTLDHVTIQNCNTTPSDYNWDDLIGMAHSSTTYHVFVSEINIYNSSIINNNRRAGSGGSTAGTSAYRGDVCRIRNGNSRIYNTTFSGNTAVNVAAAEYYSTAGVNHNGEIKTSRGYIAFVNNTVYSSGNACILANSGTANYPSVAATGLFANNIFAETSIITGSTTALQTLIGGLSIHNIIGTSYIESGITGGVAISNFGNYLTYPALTIEADALGNTAGREYHALNGLTVSPHPITDKVDNLDEIGSRVYDTEGFSNLYYDQLGKVRPQSRSIGSMDVAGFRVRNADIRLYYNSHPDVSTVPTSKAIDLSDYVLSYPGGINQTNTNFTIESESLSSIGDITAIPLSPGNSTTTFNPKAAPPYNGEGSFTFKVSVTDANGRTYEETATVRIQVLDLSLANIGKLNLPGYDGGEGVDIHCKIEMKPVDFMPRYKFITGAFDNNTIGGPAYDDIGVSNADHLGQVYDYHIPLVGDLNGDGRPEIVALGMTGNNGPSNYQVTVNAIHIFNGQTGERLLTYIGADLPPFQPYAGASSSDQGDGYHGSPGAMALIDSDRDGNVEVILAVGRTSSTATSKRLFSYKISYNGVSQTWSMQKNPKWTSYDTSYANDNDNTPAFSTPVVQIVDFNKDGKADILVYNKIFDAETGKKLLTYETLNEDPQSAAGSAYVGRDFKGRETWSKDHTGNSKIGFAYVYDLDGDGNYEICAGGKVYYNITFNPAGAVNNGTCSVLDIMDKLPAGQRAWLEGNGTLTGTDAVRAFTDGRTAVADIDGDGIPEIVASYYVESDFHFDTGSNTSTTNEPHDHGAGNKLRIVAWNAYLNKSVPQNSTVTLKAIQNIQLSNYATSGTYSYMYIADVDGRAQNGQKLPEISMLGPMFYCYMYGSTWTGYPIHPNVEGIMATAYPRTGGPAPVNRPDRAKGALISFTWDNTPGISVFDRLKVSFMMEHSDESVNTGISLFDFDNDGINEICYRDETTLRIIRPIVPFVPLNDDTGVTLFRQPVNSNTGFEYPVIVDLDGDYSGDMLVSGSEVRTSGSNYTTTSATNTYLYAIQGANIDLAPARTVWNQFMYSPLKITDRLTVPHKDSIPPHPLSPAAAFYKGAGDSYETYIYNMNIGQVPYFSVSNVGDKSVYAPLVKIANAVISNLEFVSGGTNVDTIRFVVSNAGEAAINAGTPIKIYKGETASLSAIYHETVVGSAVYPGENATIKAPLKVVADKAETFLIRVADDSFDPIEGGGNKGDVFGLDASSFADCDWTNNWDVLSDYYLRNDYYTVVPGETLVLDVLKNDILTYFPIIKTINDFTVTTLAGGTDLAKVSQKLHFTAPATGGLHCFKYTYTDDPTLPSTGYIYIYVAELETPNTLLCNGQSYTLKVKSLPSGVTFEYYESDSTTLISGNPTFTASVSKPDTSFVVKPLSVLTNVPSVNTNVGAYLPPKRIKFKVTPTTGALVTMRWTGLADTNWHNPKNWEEVGASGQGQAVTYFPSACTDVIIPSGAKNYPALTADAWCAAIKMGNRAMIAGIHWLNYETAEVEFKLNADERDRFVMWSAPLKSMYSGDYHFKEGTTPKFGDVYMNLFQHANPDGSSTVGVKNSFTATFGNLAELLEVGKAFNLKVTSTTANRDKSFIFPQTATSYQDANSVTHTTNRWTTNRKFIIDRTDGSGGSLNLPVVNDVNGSNLAQVVNPYMAYLSVSSFLAANSGKLSTAGYAIWDGSINGFTLHATIGDKDNRYEVTTAPAMSDPSGFIPPLQSFFVQKNATALLGSVAISSTWTTTAPGSPYKLRAGTQETNVLRIKAVQDKRVSYAVLHYNKSASPDYNSKEDIHKLFYQLEENEIPLEVYSFAPAKEVLAINSSNDFTQNVPLGLRTGTAGTVTLEFSGMATFGHNVYLIDHAQNNKETDLQKTPAYTFTVTKKSAGDKVIELNDRFSLRTSYTGIGTDSETISATGLSVTSRDGYIYVQTPSPASSLQVYSLTGALVYGSTTRSDYFRIQTDRQQAYIVKVKMNEEYLTQKVFVK